MTKIVDDLLALNHTSPAEMAVTRSTERMNNNTDLNSLTLSAHSPRDVAYRLGRNRFTSHCVLKQSECGPRL